MTGGRGDSQAAALLAVLDLEERDTDVYVGKTPSTERQRIFGGQVAGQALVAAGRTVPADRGVHSLHAYFLRPGDPFAEIRYAVDRIRDGRSFTTRRVVAWQERKGEEVAIFALTADFHAGETPVAEHVTPAPDVPSPEEALGTADVVARHGDKAAWMNAMEHVVEQRFLQDPFAAPPKSPPHTETRTWFRVAGDLGDDPAVHAAALTFVSDMTLLSAGFARLGGGWPDFAGASLDHAIWFHQPVRADDWLLYETDSPAASAGRALCFGKLWSADGRHVATVAQEGLIRPAG
ncbi:acyl-CoA thioesterase II [Blastococcus sp. LR1]|uniref:acyl-CoA thioesterase n=1 Tax=Blastococcus sp. LR1 TaxID=2877000 RepID=UPI001CCCFEF6|nr:acyl-CoA thioesterase II [Blastococcus sp. LR1]MCA0143511.1 acyl-CoA thioesterase II [Blastococcus sp. LR1]